MLAIALLEIAVDIGRVESQHARPVGSSLVTESVLRLDDGSERVVEHLGGTLDGIGVRVVGLPTLETGERVAVWRDGRRLLARAAVDDPRRREYVRATATRSNAPLRWADTTCMSVVPNVASNRDVDPSAALEAVQQAAANWVDATADCSYMTLIVEAPRDDVAPGYSQTGTNTNVVYWREDFWGADEEHPYPASAAGITTLRFRDEAGADDAGEILDADIEINGVFFRFTTQDCDPGAGELDLQNTLTHEMGHFLGLDHTCFDGIGDPPLDDQGLPVPRCSGTLPDEIRLATMFPVAHACDDFMRTPEPDDVDGICGVYPIDLDPGACDPDPPAASGGSDGCSCVMAGTRPAPWRAGALVLGVLAAIGAGLRERACSRSRRRSGCAAASCDRLRSSCAA